MFGPINKFKSSLVDDKLLNATRKRLAMSKEAEEVKKLDDAFQSGTVNADLILTCGGEIATWCASVTFGGPDLKTVYVGSLRSTNLPYFTAPVAGLPMVHWNESH